jgi:hypothetical protein
LLATVSAASAHPTGWHGGFPTGRPWDFASESRRAVITPLAAVSRAASCGRSRRIGQTGSFPDPVPRIKRLSPRRLVLRSSRYVAAQPLPAGSGVLGPAPAFPRGLSPRDARRHVRRH